MFEKIEHIFEKGLDCSINVVEIIGALIILYYVIKALVFLLQKKHNACRGSLTMGITTGLNFLLASEVLKTIIAPGWKEIGMTCAILLMRAGMSLLVHWENKLEAENGEPGNI